MRRCLKLWAESASVEDEHWAIWLGCSMVHEPDSSQRAMAVHVLLPCGRLGDWLIINEDGGILASML